MTSKSPVGDISVVTLIRTDTTLDHSQKAEKVCPTNFGPSDSTGERDRSNVSARLGGLWRWSKNQSKHWFNLLSLCRGLLVGGACKLTWLVLGGDPAARSHRVEQFTAL